MPNKKKIERQGNKISVKRSDQEQALSDIFAKKTPTNADVIQVLKVIYESGGQGAN
jgi:hypothetical protein